jgi:hypothetical protein
MQKLTKNQPVFAIGERILNKLLHPSPQSDSRPLSDREEIRVYDTAHIRVIYTTDAGRQSEACELKNQYFTSFPVRTRPSGMRA